MRASGRCRGHGLLASIPEGQNYLWHTDRGGGLVGPLFGWRRRYWSFLLKLAKDQPSWTIQAEPGPATGHFTGTVGSLARANSAAYKRSLMMFKSRAIDVRCSVKLATQFHRCWRKRSRVLSGSSYSMARRPWALPLCSRQKAYAVVPGNPVPAAPVRFVAGLDACRLAVLGFGPCKASRPFSGAGPPRIMLGDNQPSCQRNLG